MKIIYILALISLIFAALLSSGGLFSIIPQAIGLRQWFYILVTIATFLILIFLHLIRKGKWGLYLFFFMYPFLAQSVYYLNIAAQFFILTPIFLFLILQLLLTKDRNVPLSLQLLFLFCISTLVSVSIAQNKYNAFSFFVLGVGSFAVSAYLIYANLRTSKNAIIFIRGMILSIIAGSALYLGIETLAFRLRPSDVINIILRRWDQLPMGRFITGGYGEPAGLGFIYSLLFFVLAMLIQNKTIPRNRLMKWIERGALLFVAFVILIVGTRSALINLIYIFALLWFLQKFFSEKRLVRINARYLVLLGIIVALGAYLVIPRTIMTASSVKPPPWVEPVYIQIGSRQIRVIGSTADYVKHTRASFHDFFTKPLGVGPLNATPILDLRLGGFEAGYSYSWYTNLVVVGSTFGWLSLFLWLTFIAKVTRDLFRLRGRANRDVNFSMSLIFLAILMASLLPGAPFLGPMLNWSNFDRFLPLSPQITGLPFEYPSVISGMMLGCLIGLIQTVRENRIAQAHVHDLDPTIQANAPIPLKPNPP